MLIKPSSGRVILPEARVAIGKAVCHFVSSEVLSKCICSLLLYIYIAMASNPRAIATTYIVAMAFNLIAMAFVAS